MLEIEIVESNIIDGGIEVFARAWKDGTQLGFGKDGTIDIERFRFFNPPVLVEDTLGDIKREFEQRDDNGVIQTSVVSYIEDPEEAILQSLESTLAVMKNVHTDSNIIVGKRGNTTSTFYPDAGTGVTTVDGKVDNFNISGWSTVRDGATGSAVSAIATSIGDYMWRLISGKYYVSRLFWGFDTSALGTDSVDSATFSLYQKSGGSNPGSYLQTLSGATLDSNSNLTTSDWDSYDTLNSPTEFITRIEFPVGANDEYKSMVLNASGESYINKTGITEFVMRWVGDTDNTAPTTSDNTNLNGCLHFADETGTTKDPKLVVEHAAASTANNSARRLHLMSL